MDNIFLKILNMSITASYLVIAVVLLRLLLKKAPRAVAVAMWALVGLRLILPFSFESVLSLIPSAQTIPADIALSPAPTIQTGIPALNAAINPTITQSFAPNPGTSANPLQILIPIAAIIWILGMVVMALYALISWFLLRRRVSECIQLKENVYLGDRVPTPFILGIFRPRIYLPSGTDAADIPYILAHEKAHLQRKDHLWKPLGFLLLAIHWFNPLIWAAYILLCRDIELACDEKVIKKLGFDSKKPYSQALISCSVPRRSISACPLAFGEVNVKGRIKSVLNYKKPAFWVILIAVLLCIGLAVGFLTDPKEETAPELTGSEPANMACVEEKPVLMGDTEEFSLVFGGNYSLHHTLTVSQLHPVWCLTVNNIGPDTVKVEIQGTVYSVAPDTTAYIYATEDWAPGDYPVSFASTQPMEGNVRCSLHMSHGFSSAGTVIGGADGPGSILIEATPKPEDFLRRHYPQYFGLSQENGLHVYIWQFAQSHYACVLLAGEGQYTELEMLAMDPVSIPQMRKILASYGVSQKEVTLHPFNHPASSYYYEIDDAYRKNLETLFWQPTMIQSSQNFGIEMAITPVDDLVFDLTLTHDPNGSLPGTARTWEVCELSVWYEDTWYPIDEYLRDICKRDDVPERLPWSMELIPFSQAEPYTQRVDFGAVYGDLPAGQYLIRKQTPFYPENGECILCYCGVEFSVSE